MRIIKIPADPAVAAEVVDIDGSLKSLQEAIGGGWIERVNIRERLSDGSNLVMVVDEDGIGKRLPPNPRAMQYYPGLIAGDVFLCGEKRDSDGEVDFCSIPDDYETRF